MASAWEQAAEIQPVNQRLRQLQVSMAVGEACTHGISSLSEDMTLRFAAGLRPARMPTPELDPAGRTSRRSWRGTALPSPRRAPPCGASAGSAGRCRGIAAKGAGRSIGDLGGVPEPGHRWRLRPRLRSCRRPSRHCRPWRRSSAPSGTGASWSPRRTSRFLHCRPPILPPGWDYPGHFRKAAADHLARVGLRPTRLVHPAHHDEETVESCASRCIRAWRWRNLVRAAITTGDNVLPPTAPGVTPMGTETLMMEPSFPQPICEALKEKSQELLLPGLDKVLPDTVLGLRTNRAFVEAYMIGLNVEMARELLWRGFPTDQRGTYFQELLGQRRRRRGGQRHRRSAREPGRALGGAAELARQPVRAPAAQQPPAALPERDHLSDAGRDRQQRPPDIYPIFNGAMEPDINFAGFPIAPGVAIGGRGNPGYYVVIQEHPTEPRSVSRCR